MTGLLLLALAAFAQDDGEEGTLYAHTRIIASQLSDFEVDADGTQFGQNHWLDARLRVGASMPFFLGTLDTEWDVNTAQLFGERSTLPGFADERERNARILQIIPRKLSITSLVGPYQLSVGLTTSHWGLGMLANDGAHPDWWGRADFGDRVLRFRATHLPYSEGRPKRTERFTTVALDMVVGDEMSRLDRGQIAVQGILSMVWKTRNDSQWGAYTVLRHQRERDRTRSTTAMVADLYADGYWDINDWSFRVAGEAAVILGHTNRATTYNYREAQSIGQLGATGLISLTNPEESLTMRIRSGYASGDANPDNGVAGDFVFDRDFSAGLVLFDQLNGGIEAATYNQLTDPEVSGQPPDGVDALVTEGAFRRAAFVQPAISVRPIKWMSTRIGTTLSWATAPVSQPFYTYRAGGSARNHLNTPSAGRYLGTEVHWAIAFDQLGAGPVGRTQLEFQVGHLLLGDVMKAGGNTEVIHHAMGVLRTEW